MNINDRLDRIEDKLKPAKAEKPTVWIIHLVKPGQLDRPVTRIRHGNQEWTRLDGETEEAFQLRAESEAVRQAGRGLVMVMD